MKGNMRQKVLPENILKCLPKDTRKSIGQMTSAEALAKQEERLEKDIHKNISGWLHIRNVFFIRSRMDKRTTNGNGLPDYVVVLPALIAGNLPRCLMVEVKLPKKKLSQDQEDFHANYLNKTGCRVQVVYSLQDFINLITPFL